MRDYTLVLIPGMAADDRLFIYQKPVFPNLTIVPWLLPKMRESLRDYSHRMAAEVPKADNLIIGGVSMGGMVTQEMATLLRPRGQILISTCRHPSELTPRARSGASFERFLPDFIGAFMPKIAKFGMSSLGVREPAHKEVILQIARDISFPFAKWAADAILQWPGGPQPACPVLRIHGTRDRIIRYPKVTPPGTDFVSIEKAGHVPNLTHAPQVNRAIASWIATLPEA